MKKLFNSLLIAFALLSSVQSYATNYDSWINYMMNMIVGSHQATDEQAKMLEKALKEGADYKKYLTPDQVGFIENYTINPEMFNEMLKDGYDIDDPQSMFAKVLDSSLEKLPTQTRVTYRGGAYPKGVYSKLIKKGNVVYNNIFASTSYSASIAKEFADSVGGAGVEKVVFAIESTDGVNISNFSPTFTKEAEILLRPDSYFEVKKVKKGGDGTIYVAMKEVDPPKSRKTKVRHMYHGDILDCD
ncbi:hypothetical protein HGP28_07535 [Vibrio sp. SM6]|uniref:NAD(+)--protein-arginine ADP-ribosyltransferase n=1 Tax=Vibrio agarilyticus TaxID=2726741 RepID=A0A7X8TQ45_9VIBR|nr:ADP-ribosyltransferase domain-containing protein [Vibrio agarilyticus]NLS12756.1 hypothetical protein [Vibrio agarilyticus]